jgi:hypothetical protein
MARLDFFKMVNPRGYPGAAMLCPPLRVARPFEITEIIDRHCC